MLFSYIKYFFISLCTIYIFIKILKLSPKRIFHCIYALFCIAIPFAVYFSRIYFSEFTIPILIVLTTLIFKLTNNLSLNIIAISVCISYGLSYLFNLLFTLLFAILSLLLNIDTNNTVIFAVYLIIIGISQTVLTYLLFSIRKFKAGMPFLLFKAFNDWGILVSAVLLLGISIISNNSSPTSLFIIAILIILICGILLYVWWKRQINKTYIERLRVTEVENLRTELFKTQSEYERLAALVHKDNKIIHAMVMSVSEFLETYNSHDEDIIISKSNSLLKALDDLSRDRYDFTLSSRLRNSSFQSTGVIVADATISYLYARAQREKVAFSFTSFIDAKLFINKFINEDLFITLLSDLAENAMISTRSIDNAIVSVSLSTENGFFGINVYDNGTPFDINVLADIGIYNHTTHKDTGGSGIGLMTMWKILKNHGASFVIDEIITDTYTKKVSVYFDGMSQYRIKTHREAILELSKKRKDLLVDFFPTDSIS